MEHKNPNYTNQLSSKILSILTVTPLNQLLKPPLEKGVEASTCDNNSRQIHYQDNYAIIIFLNPLNIKDSMFYDLSS